MKLRSFLFGSSRRDFVPTMNQPSRRREMAQDDEMRQESRRYQNNDTDMRRPCNPPPRDRNNEEGEICNPYGKLLPDAEKYPKHIKDKGNYPYIFSFGNMSRDCTAFREAFWTGEHMQLVRMNIPAGEDIGKEIHEDTDQLITVTDGKAEVLMGRGENRMSHLGELRNGDSVIIPAGHWHNIINRGSSPLKIISIYSPPHHPYGTMQKSNSKHK